MSDRLARYRRTLAGLERKGRRRALLPEAGRDFTSNDFLGLANSDALKDAVANALARGVPVGSGGSRLLRGNHPEHEALEAEAAAFFGVGRCLFFGNGFTANLALFSTLPQREDRIFHDELVHASALDGIGQSKATAVSFPHNDVTALEDLLRAWRNEGGRGQAWIAVESLYSMDGDFAPLADLASLADRHDAFLVIDEAHATGVHGAGGRGAGHWLEGRENVVSLHTCGKALGASGALIGAAPALCDFLVNRGRPFIYSTSPSPLMAATVRQSLKIVEDEPQRREALLGLVSLAGDMLRQRLGIDPGPSQIVPVPIGDNARAVRIAEAMRAAGFDIRAIRPPTVPEGTARLRLSLTLNVTPEDIAEMVECLSEIMQTEMPGVM
ncbi:8-amino-7-oxononanoate synthase [Gellertiella hungarica]|uniref:8-amino-7-oxononanoate synthase n=1 Tax=Gellertiella hungarica TaxID=1572859 RepID=A0A7W6J4P0_9HYPH|nr:8-amino-7-oxononanoate synthase [Gellertiella hungarica]MBB4064725.1 8-amino-7-oxononanoate synthase [Gellertiella hungarica]